MDNLKNYEKGDLSMTDKKSRRNKIDKKVLEYSIMGDAFIGASNMTGDLDNSCISLWGIINK